MEKTTEENTTKSAFVPPQSTRTYCDRLLLEIAKTRLAHAEYGQKRAIPKSSGDPVKFQRYELFDPEGYNFTLEEGITPPGAYGRSTARTVEADCKQYSTFVKIMNPVLPYECRLTEAIELLGEQSGIAVELNARNVLNSGTNVQYANGRIRRSQLTQRDVMTVTEIRKAVRTLKKAHAPMFVQTPDGRKKKPHYLCLCSPDASEQLQNDALWQDISKYWPEEPLYNDEIGKLFGVVFVENPDAMVFRQSVFTRVIGTDHGYVIEVEKITHSAAAYLKAGARITVGENEYVVATSDQAKSTITLLFPARGTIQPGMPVYSNDAGAADPDTHKAMDVRSSIIFGENAYGVSELDQDCMRVIFTMPDDGGVLIYAKTDAYSAKILNQMWMVRIEHAGRVRA
jgi:N4-gp56 family major capsid protein